ncbi:MAG: hypothetical protein WBF66_02250 [Dehalococcoidia bacterium]
MAESEGLGRDLLALRRHLWFPVATLVLALAVAAGVGLAFSPSDEAAFRVRVRLSAQSPLFGPPILPSTEDLARLAVSPEVLERASGALAAEGIQVSAEEMAGRVSASVGGGEGAIGLTVKDGNGERALATARAWESAFAAVAQEQAPELERRAAADYQAQLDVAASLLEEKRQAAAGQGPDSAAQQELEAARENYQVASRLQQSYEVVARMLRLDLITERAPYLKGGAALDWAGRMGAAVAFGVVVGVLGALGLEVLARRRLRDVAPPAPAEAERPPSPSP